jgi:guanylate kinase
MARILLGVTGGIAAYKALETARLAVKAGHSVRVIQTPMSEQFVGRGTDGPEQVDKRLRTAEQELEAQPEFGHVVVNDRLEQATDELVAIVQQSLK